MGILLLPFRDNLWSYLQGKAVPEELTLENRTTGFPETSVTKEKSRELGYKPRRGRGI
jgi:hypothetical protein